MFARVSERKMLSVRGVLFLAWLGLIASLFWDPFTVELTRAENLASPFRTTEGTVPIQDLRQGSEPYAMGARVFWTMAVPLLPLFLMVFGHEAWRRICPLSFASQIPGYLGLQRRRSALNRRNGMVQKAIVLVERSSWLGRNAWYVQFGLLFAGVTARLLIINSDRHALAVALITVIAAAMLTGLLWGGKTWCNYFCPANIVQKIYTEPRGLLESAPHLDRPAIPQSMCRKPGPEGDQSACVACTVNCGDIDLERAYWQGILDPRRRNTYYMFLGLIFGFYGYYYVYAGNWDYYFSGIWTHEAGIAGRLTAPGVFLFGQALAVPKFVAAPVTLALSCLASLGLGRLLEAGYRRYRAGETRFSEAEIVNHCLSVSAWASINAFYFFGGRPNLLLLPELGTRLVDLLIVSLTTMWLRQALQCSPGRYERESMTQRLLDQLRRLKVDVSRYLGGRNLEDLKPDALYVLSKVLPGFSHSQKLDAYRNVLGDAVADGGTASPSTNKLLGDLRGQMEISDEEHTQIVEELGFQGSLGIEGVALSEDERRAGLPVYRDLVGNFLAERLAAGRGMDELLAEPDVRATIQILRDSLQVTETEHLTALAALAGQDGILSQRMDELLGQIVDQQGMRFCIEAVEAGDPLGRTLADLLSERLRTRESALCVRALSMLGTLSGGPAAAAHARSLAAIAADQIRPLLRAHVAPGAEEHWEDCLPQRLLQILRGEEGPGAPPAARSPRQVLAASADERGNLQRLLEDPEPLMRALGLAVFSYLDDELAHEAAFSVAGSPAAEENEILRSVAARLSGSEPRANVETEPAELRIDLEMPGRPRQSVTMTAGTVRIGRAFDNDIVLNHPGIWAYHAVLKAARGAVELQRLDGGEVRLDGQLVTADAVPLARGAEIGLGAAGAEAARLGLSWDSGAAAFETLAIEPVMRLAMLVRNAELRRLPLAALGEIALGATARRYLPHARVISPEFRPGHFLVHFGRVRLFDPARMDYAPGAEFGPGDILHAELAQPYSELVPEIDGDFAVLLQLAPSDAVAAAARRGAALPPGAVRTAAAELGRARASGL